MRRYGKNGWFNFFRGLNTIRLVIVNLIFWVLVIIILGFLVFDGSPRIRRNTVLKVNPEGTLVDNKLLGYDRLIEGKYNSGSLLSDLITAIDAGWKDSRIQGMWLDLDLLGYAGPAAAGELADAVQEFANSGKPVIASAGSYGTSGYRIASSASRIVLDRMGEVFPTGYGAWAPYFAEGLEKLGAEVQIFRSGESKSAPEGFIRNDMSETAKRDHLRLYEDLWDLWLNAVARNRDMNPGTLEKWISGYDKHLIDAGGDASAAARNAFLVDDVETGGVRTGILNAEFGENASYMEVSDYLEGAELNRSRRIVAVVPITGILVSGSGAAEMVGSSKVVDTLKKVQEMSGVKAVVLRIDSPGGDAWAAEEIRREVQELRKELPVVVSMGNYAASGGYWIAVESDAIVARPETITGSIGAYSYSVSLEKGLAEWLGIHFDGVGTTPWYNMNGMGRGMDERMASIYQSGLINVDGMFRNLVAGKRHLSEGEITLASGGMGWSGRQAIDLGLVDMLGGLQAAVTHAAEMAGLKEWQVKHVAPSRDLLETLVGLEASVRDRKSVWRLLRMLGR